MNSKEVIRGILSDRGYFYLGTVIDGVRTRAVGAGGMLIVPQHIQRVVYMCDTNLLLQIDPNREIVGPLTLQAEAKEELGSDYEVTFHEIGSVVTGILEGKMSYMDWVRMPIIDQPDPEYLRKIFTEFEAVLDDCHLALVKRMSPGYLATWMPLDYRYAQLLAFARTGKIEVNYFTALAHLQENAGGYEVYEGAISEVRFQHLEERLRSIESNARRGIL